MDKILIKAWLDDITKQAADGGHIFPNYAACEAGLESGYGTSLLARKANNLFGQKSRSNSPYGVLDLPTKEFENGEWITVTAHWISFPDYSTCFKERMATLTRLRRMYPEYNLALEATDGISYIQSVSKRWSTDPHRADKVLEIYNEFYG